MIQRKQTLYLSLATILTSLLFFLKLATLANDENIYSMFYNGIFPGSTNYSTEPVMSVLAFTILLYISVILYLVTIFLFKRRILQIRLAGLNIGLQVGLTVLIYFFARTAGNELGAVYSFGYAMVFPLISVVFLIMAIKAIGRDEALVRSMDRIR